MRKFKMVSVMLSAALLFNLFAPVAHAVENNIMDHVWISGNIAAYGIEDSDKLYNIVIDTTEMRGDFAIVYSDAPDYMYQYTFDLPLTDESITSASFWSNLIIACLENSSDWETVYLPNAVQIESEPEGISMQAADSNVSYFKDYLEDLYGTEYLDDYLRSATRDGVSMKQLAAMQHDAIKDNTYKIVVGISVVGFITGILGLLPNPGLVAAISAIAGAGGLLASGAIVYKYSLRTDWLRYVTVNNGTYLYSLTAKVVHHTGYVSSETGGRMVDTDSEEVSYDPSSSYYNSYSSQFSAAYDEYIRLGWMG